MLKERKRPVHMVQAVSIYHNLVQFSARSVQVDPRIESRSFGRNPDFLRFQYQITQIRSFL